MYITPMLMPTIWGDFIAEYIGDVTIFVTSYCVGNTTNGQIMVKVGHECGIAILYLVYIIIILTC